MAHEVFAVRTYQKDGTLTPRNHPRTLIQEHEESIQQVLTMVKEKKVKTIDGEEIDIKANTICLHGDGTTQ